MKWHSLMPLKTDGTRRSTRLVDEAHGGIWDVAAKTNERGDLFRLVLFHRNEGQREWAQLVLDEGLNIVALTVGDRETKTFEDVERVLAHKGLD